MNVKKTFVLLCVLCVVVSSISCVKDVDFDQTEDVVLTPVFEIDFVYSRFNTDRFVNPEIDPSIVVPEVFVNDTLDYDLLGTDFIVDNLERIELTFEFRNTIERDFEFTLGFLDDNGVQVGPFNRITVNAGNGEGVTPVVTTEVIVFDNATINILATAAKLISTIQVQNINSSLGGILEMRSKGTYFINYDL